MSSSTPSTSEPVEDGNDPGYLLKGRQIGYYTIVRRIGAGQFGAVYEAKRGDRRYALKIATYKLSELSPEERKHQDDRVKREVAALISLNHPNIVGAHAFETWPEEGDGHPYIIMDYVEGPQLYRWRERSKPPLRAICDVGRKLGLALGAMHERELYHRDLKSDNILVRTSDGEPVIVDFGIARPRFAYTMTRDASVIGTHSHLAPEYVEFIGSDAFHRGETAKFPYKPTTDLHALGFTLYELIAGRSPFGNGPDDELLHRIVNVVPERLSAVNGKVPGSVEAVVMRLLEKSPEDRFQTGGELAEAFEKVLEGADASWDKPLQIPPPPSPDAPTPRQGKRGGKKPLGTGEVMGEQKSPAKAFSPPTEERRVFKPPEDARGDAPLGEGARGPALPSQILRAGEKIAASARAGRGRVRLPALALGSAGLIAAGVLYLASSGKSAPKPESLLAKVEKESHGAEEPPPPVPVPPSALPPAPLVEAKPKPGPERQPDPAPKPAGPRKESDAANVNALLQASYGPHPTVPAVPAGAQPAPRPESPSWLKVATMVGPATAPAVGPKAYGIPTGAHIKARLVTNLDSRTISSGPVEAVLSRPYLNGGEVVLPTRTMLYGRAQTTNGRFVIEFGRMRLPDNVEVAFSGLAFDSEEKKPGLPAGRRIAGAAPKGDSLITKVAKGTANQVLTTVSGGTAEDVARNAGQTALGHSEQPESASGDALLLDAGVLFDVFVEKPF
jgi:serine/threonine-protein kinase